MQLRKAASVLALITLIGCGHRRVIVLDSWWNADFAKQGCRSVGAALENTCGFGGDSGACADVQRRKEACILSENDTGGVYDFQASLKSSFAQAPECRGIDLVEFDGTRDVNHAASKAVMGSHWTLMLDFDPGAPSQSWSVVGPKSETVTGEGNVDEIARKACAVVNGRGAHLVS
jgi:hypothetical protein